MVLRLSTIRKRVASMLTAALAEADWKEASDPYDQFGASDGDRLDKSFAVGVPSTTAGPDRQRLTEGAYVETVVGVRWAFNLAALDQVTAYDDALDIEQTVLAAAVMQREGLGLHLVFVSSSRGADDQGWMTGTILFKAVHRLPLQ